MRHLLRCTSCKKYTLDESCLCGGKAISPAPPKYSPDDKYADYRRKAKEDIYKGKGFL